MSSDCGLTGNSRSKGKLLSASPSHLLGRLYLLAAILALEFIFIVGALHLDPSFLFHPLRAAIVAFAVFLGLGHGWLKAHKENLPFGFWFFGGYLACVATAIAFHVLTVHNGAAVQYSRYAPLVFSAAFLFEIPLLALACVPLRVWIRAIRATHPLWLYAVLAGVAASLLQGPSDRLWTAAGGVPGRILQATTFEAVHSVFRHFASNIAVDAVSYTIGTPHYSIVIGLECSGMEGLGLILAFTSAWLWYFRKECRFPQALLLIPCALVCIWVLNVVRICLLFFIGDEISSDVAMVGFHSRAGWIAFTAIALAFSMATRGLAWARKAPTGGAGAAVNPHSGGIESVFGGAQAGDEQGGESPAIRAYLTPFLAILAAGFISKAASGNFEWLYPLRLIAAATALWFFRRELKRLDWRFGWFGPLAGAAVFLAWIAPCGIKQLGMAQFGWGHPPVVSPLGAALAALSPAVRWSWISVRVAAAIITVPIAEELAFRGYLARRLMSREFDKVPFSRLTALSVCLSSVVFGLEHMSDLMDWQHFALGTLAGLAFAAALRWRGRMGDAVAAHAVSNLLLAAWVLGFGDWSQW
jgi:exosortase E/protease (VPEID-CTERM system)